jgi:hypothetical protein
MRTGERRRAYVMGTGERRCATVMRAGKRRRGDHGSSGAQRQEKGTVQAHRLFTVAVIMPNALNKL